MNTENAIQIIANSLSRPVNSTSRLSSAGSVQDKRQENAGELQSLTSATDEKQAPSNSELLDTVAQLNDHMQALKRELQFSIDDESGKVVVKVIDSESDEVIKQIPSEELLAIARYLTEEDQGGLVRELA